MNQDDVGRAAHEAWKAWRIAGGYPDHAFRGGWIPDRSRLIGERWGCLVCSQEEIRHHEDMVDWDDLWQEKRQKYIVQAEAGARVERERWASILREVVDAWTHMAETAGGGPAANVLGLLEGRHDRFREALFVAEAALATERAGRGETEATHVD